MVEALQSSPTAACEYQMKGIANASREWALEHDGKLPPNVRSLSNQLESPHWLVCPQSSRIPANDNTWTNSSYLLLHRDAVVTNTNTVFLHCTIHGHGAYLDGRFADTNIINRLPSAEELAK